jgi:hypothetical protein
MIGEFYYDARIGRTAETGHSFIRTHVCVNSRSDHERNRENENRPEFLKFPFRAESIKAYTRDQDFEETGLDCHF